MLEWICHNKFPETVRDSCQRQENLHIQWDSILRNWCCHIMKQRHLQQQLVFSVGHLMRISFGVVIVAQWHTCAMNVRQESLMFR